MHPEETKFSDTLVGDVYEQVVKRPATVTMEAKIVDVIDGMIANPLSRKVYVVDGKGKLRGMINTDTVLRLIGYRTGVRQAGALSFYRFLRDMMKEDISSLITPTRAVTAQDRLTDALRIMVQDHVNDLPVIDEGGSLIGELVSLELFLKGKELFDKEVEPSETMGSP